MQVSDTKVTITYKGREYRSSVVRRPDESLPVVTDEQGAVSYTHLDVYKRQGE